MFTIFAACLALALAVPAAADDSGPADRKRLIETAFKYKGVPYVYGSESPRAFDCSGFVRFVYREAFGIELPRSARGFVSVGKVIDPKTAIAGDVYIFDTVGGAPSHVALVVGDGTLIHAVSAGPRTGVIVSPMTDRYWAPRVIGARSFLAAGPSPLAKPAASTAPAASADASGPKPTTAAAASAAPPVKPSAPASTAPAATAAAATPQAASAATASPAATSAQATATQPVIAAKPAATAAPSAPAVSSAPARTDEVAIVDIGFTIPAQAETYADKIPTKAGTELAFTVTNGTGKDGTFIVVFFRVDPKTYKLEKIHEQKAILSKDAAYSLPPYRFEKAGKYRLIVRDNWGMQLFERSFMVTDEI